MEKLKKNDMKFISIFIIIVLLAFLYLGVNTYSKYRKQVAAKGEATVARWLIKVNTEDIKGKTQLTNNITPVWDANSYVKDDLIAPGSTGYFEITIDATQVDVDFNYEIENLNDSTAALPDLIITSYQINGGTVTNSTGNTITGTINKNTASTTIKAYIKWNDDPATQSMDNQADTTFAQQADTTADISLRLKFTQKTA